MANFADEDLCFRPHTMAYPTMMEIGRTHHNANPAAATSAAMTTNNHHVPLQASASLPSMANLNMLPQHPVLVRISWRCAGLLIAVYFPFLPQSVSVIFFIQQIWSHVSTSFCVAVLAVFACR